MTSLDRTLAILDLFTEDEPMWTVERLMARQGYSRATAYRYVKGLCNAGLLTSVAGSAYMLGPRIIELDRQIRLTDPLLLGAQSVIRRLRDATGECVLLCSLYRDRVLCIDREPGDQPLRISYARGRPMPLFRGATSKIILAFMPWHRQRALFLAHGKAIAAAELGADWASFKANLRTMRRGGQCIARGEVDPGNVGLGVAVRGAEGHALGSLSIVLAQSRASPAREIELIDGLKAAAAEIEQTVRALTPAEDG